MGVSMVRSALFGGAICSAALLLAEPASARELSYYLPQGEGYAGYNAQIVSCPTDNSRFEFIHGPSIRADYKPGRLVRLDPTSAFLGSRSVALTYHGNGTLKTINAKGEGKGGAVVASLAKFGVGLAGLVTGFPAAAGIVGLDQIAIDQGTTKGGSQALGSRDVLRCKQDVLERVATLVALKEQVNSLETHILAGDITPAQKVLYDDYLKQIAKLEKELTITTSVIFLQGNEVPNSSTGIDLTLALKAPDVTKWLEVVSISPFGTPAVSDDGGKLASMVARAMPKVNPLPGEMCVNIAVDADTIGQSAPVDAVAWPSGPGRKQLSDNLLFYRPVPVSVRIAQRADNKADCTNKASLGKKLAEETIRIPQLSKLFAMPLGSGAFESKAIAAEFTEEGRIISMSYTSSGSGAGAAEALTGALSAAETYRDAETASIKREIERIKAQNELDALREAADGDGG